MEKKFLETRISRVRFLCVIGIVSFAVLFIASILTFCMTGVPPVFDRSNLVLTVWLYTALVILLIPASILVTIGTLILLEAIIVVLVFLSYTKAEYLEPGFIKIPARQLREISPTYNAFVVGMGKAIVGATRVITFPFWGPVHAIRNWINKGRE